MTYGTITALDTLAASTATVFQYGEDRALEAVQTALEVHNRITTEMVNDLCETTTDNARRYGPGSDVGDMEETDEFGSPDAQKTSFGSDVGFPLRLFSRAVQWTRTAWFVITAAELAAQTSAIMAADRINIQRWIKRAVYYPTNTSYKDVRLKNVTLPVKAFLNNDGTVPPMGPNGETFLGTHNHYGFSATYTEAAALAMLNNVLEHRNEGTVRIYINSADEATWRAFTAFVPLQYVATVPATSTVYADMPRLDVNNQKNRIIGYFYGAEVWVKPWIIANYPIAIRLGVPGEKPLGFRKRDASGGFGDLMLVYDNELHPLRARGYEREFGVAPWQRDMVVVLDGAHSSYTFPTIS